MTTQISVMTENHLDYLVTHVILMEVQP